VAEPRSQSFENHTRYVPGFHYGVLGVLTLNLLYGAYRVVKAPGLDTGMGLLLAVALLGLLWYARRFALTVQDRVIRLEMQFRLQGLLPAELKPRIPELTRHQLVALRFASDEELPELTRAVLAEGITSRTAIKRRIRRWQSDNLRA
jgi:hypothetical protein